MGLYFEYLITDLLALLCILATTVFLYYKYTFSYWEYKGVSFLKPEFPFGNVKPLILRQKNFGVVISDIYFKLKKDGRRYGGFYFAAQPNLLILDPELIKLILQKDFNHFNGRGIFYNEKVDPLGGNIFALHGNKWRTLRNKVSPTFTSGKIKAMFPLVTSCADHLGKVLEKSSVKGEVVGMKDLLSRFTIDVIGSCVFGLDCNCLENPEEEFKKQGQRFIQTFLANSWQLAAGILFPSLLKFFNVRQIDSNVSKFFLNILQDNIAYREKNNIHRNDFMELFIKLKNNEDITDEALQIGVKTDIVNEGITYNELAAQALVFFIAGYETSSTTGSLCLYELAQNLDVQEKLRKEINDVIEANGGTLTYDGIMNMGYLDNVVNETLRKYPVAPNLLRMCNEDYKIPDSYLVIEKGTRILISILGIHNDPEYYPNPKKFDPERFTEEEKEKRIPFTYIPFGDGPRQCIGMRFAKLQTKIALVAMLRSTKYDISPKTEHPLQWTNQGVLLFPKNEIWLKTSKVD